MAQLGHIMPEIHKAGARVVVVGNGTPAMARMFAEDHPIDAALYVDPDLKVYEAAGLKRSWQRIMNVDTLKAGMRAMKEGHFQGLTKGDKWQLGGTFLVWPGGVVNYSHISKFAGDLAPHADVFKALRNPPQGMSAPSPV